MIRPYRVIVDGEDAATIRRGQTMEIDVSPGRHRVVAAIDWARSNPVEIDAIPGSYHRLEVGSSMAGWRLLLASLYITIWRDRYLYLRET